MPDKTVWKPLSIPQVAELLRLAQCPWWIAGGWAIDLFIGRQTREHSDTDIVVLRCDQLKIQDALLDWDLHASDPPGTLRPWKSGEFLQRGVHNIWCRPSANDAWQLQIMFFESEDDKWVYRRNNKVREPLSTLGLTNNDRVSYLNPQVQLLFKSIDIREKDQLDFDNVLPHMSVTQQKWLRKTLNDIYSGVHPWIERIQKG